MKDNFYKQIVEELPTGYAYSKIICDEYGIPYDFEFLEVNAAFEKLSGLTRSEVVGKRATQVIQIIRNIEVDWIKLFGEVALKGKKKEFEQFFEASQRWYKINVYSPEKFYCITHIIEITKEMIQLSEMERLIEVSERLLQTDDENISFQGISDDFLKICGANYAAFNLFDQDGKSYTTKAITGDKGIVKRISGILGFKLEDKKWEYNPELAEKIKSKTITRFHSLRELVGSTIEAPLVALVEKVLNIGEVVLIKILKNNVMLGDFTLFIEKGKSFDKDTLAEVYTRQLGMLIIRKRAESQLLHEKTLTEAIFNSTPGMIYLYDDQSRLVRWNKKHEEITGYSSEELSKMSLLDWYKDDEKSQKAVKEGIDKAIKEGFGEAEAQLQKKDGSKVSMYFTASTLYFENNLYFAGIGIDITERKKREVEIFNLSYYDQLTGLYNRRFYEEELKRLDKKRNLPLTIVMGDVNGLKLINDSFGHVMGDELLKKVAEIIKQGCRADDIIARLAGDEFVILLPKTDEFETEQIIKRITESSLNEKVGSIDISISFGYHTKNNEEEPVEVIFKNAEDHMYEKKLFESQSMRGRAIKAIINALHEKSKKEEKHSFRVSELCKNMGVALGLPEHENEVLKTVGLLHDIGKIAIDENILNKSGELTEDELKEFNRHSEIGYRMLNTVNDMSEIANYVLYHHENWDGSGYPKGLKGKEIPLVSRIIALVDAYDDMTNENDNRNSMSNEPFITVLQTGSGIKFDPFLLKVFVEKVLGKI